jgi:hypothetical protein
MRSPPDFRKLERIVRVAIVRPHMRNGASVEAEAFFRILELSSDDVDEGFNVDHDARSKAY